MTTQNATPEKVTPVETQIETPPNTNGVEVASERARDVLEQCSGVRISFKWLPNSRQVDKNTLSRMVAAVDSTSDGVSSSKRLIDTKHPLIKEANQLRTQIMSYVHGTSVSLAGLTSDTIEHGVRLIHKDDLPTFDARLHEFSNQMQEMKRRLNESYEEIKESSRKRLKNLFNDSDYPTELHVGFEWEYPSVRVDSSLAELAPEVYQQQVQQAEDRLNRTVDLMVSEIAGGLCESLERLEERLSPVVMLYPGSHHGRYNELFEAVVVKSDQREDGKFDVKLTPKSGGYIQEVFTAKEWESLNPMVNDQRKKRLHGSTVENVQEAIDQFRKFSSIVGSDETLSAQLDEFEKKLGDNPQDARDRMAASQSYRQAMASMSCQLCDTATTYRDRAVSKPRRIPIESVNANTD